MFYGVVRTIGETEWIQGDSWAKQCVTFVTETIIESAKLGRWRSDRQSRDHEARGLMASIWNGICITKSKAASLEFYSERCWTTFHWAAKYQMRNIVSRILNVDAVIFRPGRSNIAVVTKFSWIKDD